MISKALSRWITNIHKIKQAIYFSRKDIALFFLKALTLADQNMFQVNNINMN